MAEFLFSIFLMLGGTMFLSVGIIAEMTAYNYFQRNGQPPYRVRTISKDIEKGSVFPLSHTNQVKLSQAT